MGSREAHAEDPYGVKNSRLLITNNLTMTNCEQDEFDLYH